jgi:hypothetical protein
VEEQDASAVRSVYRPREQMPTVKEWCHGMAGGDDMATVLEGSEVATVGRGMEGEDTSSRLMTTLYDLIAAIQDVVGAEDDTMVVATMVHLLQSGRLTWFRMDYALR